VTKNGLENLWFLWAGSSALSEDVSRHECLSNGRVFLGGSSYHQEHSWSGIGFEKIHSQIGAHILSVEQKLRRVTEFKSLLTILANLAKENFQWIITGDQSWFAYSIESDAMFASSPAEVIPRVRSSVSCKKVIITFFQGKRQLISQTLAKGSKYNQD
jgi:hypothetical protein